jgi:hypothetical protein
MSHIAYRIRNAAKRPAASGLPGRTPVAVGMSTIGGALRKVIAWSGKLLMRLAQVHAEARMHRAQIETEFYRNRYKHASKNDDDLPIAS